MMIATFGTVLVLSVGCTSKSVEPTEQRVPAQEGLGTGNIGSSAQQTNRADEALTSENKVTLKFEGIESADPKSIRIELNYECSTSSRLGTRVISNLITGDTRKEEYCGHHSDIIFVDSNYQFVIPKIKTFSFAGGNDLNNFLTTLTISNLRPIGSIDDQANEMSHPNRISYFFKGTDVKNLYIRPVTIKFKKFVISNLELFLGNKNLVDTTDLDNRCANVNIKANVKSSKFNQYQTSAELQGFWFKFCRNSEGVQKADLSLVVPIIDDEKLKLEMNVVTTKNMKALLGTYLGVGEVTYEGRSSAVLTDSDIINLNRIDLKKVRSYKNEQMAN